MPDALPEISDLVERYILPQVWNALGQSGPDRYIEAQVWEDDLVRRALAGMGC